MSNPYAPPAEARTDEPIVPRPARAWIDWLLAFGLLLLLLPSVVFDALLWLQVLLGLGVYDPALGGDPIFQARPILIPVIVSVAAVGRLAISTSWRVARFPKWLLVALSLLALLTLAASLIPTPQFPQLL